ncbi:hypothetical protein R69927_07341 [Paraburkholderia domus]|jgi:Predicted acetamidase/formamidase|uniref:Uncharacterized protein n=1 Tax=Paraburkholderia domus TaxID=2793075 RepID=A0A9N8N2R5_9BURK|nr:acetamidase/formamidase family protein [Paraburkholderia domus]CAE6857532.1 hypothetical protein R70006_07904 [Paraburkholderia domus]CAE6878381.1 hypothetical protein R75471_01640 [Paraburkholderia domus]CAE6908093.1 hypothetical protein R69749_08501 [Paraburkholderia domus]CAE6934308.1 hypothetical protein R69927_07341 [Paraburkholderia domus]CAE6943176.1 hypothetical protein R70211_05815 [Paraburkholderia domus]
MHRANVGRRAPASAQCSHVVSKGCLTKFTSPTFARSPVALAAKFELVKKANLTFPRFTTSGPVSRHLDTKGYEVTTGIGPDLMEGARAAVSGMIDILTRQHHISAIDAYLLCSVCADLHISEIVDQPNRIVSLYFPRIIFE